MEKAISLPGSMYAQELSHLAFCMKDGWSSSIKDSGIAMQPSEGPSLRDGDACQRLALCKGKEWPSLTEGL